MKERAPRPERQSLGGVQQSQDRQAVSTLRDGKHMIPLQQMCQVLCSAGEIQQGDPAMTDTVTCTLRLSGKDGDDVPRRTLRPQMVASQGTGSSLGDHSSWTKVSGSVISHRRDQEKEAVAWASQSIDEDSG